jgi:hypothetical protein
MIPAGIKASFIYIPENGDFQAQQQYRYKPGQKPEEIFEIQLTYELGFSQGDNDQAQRKGHVEYHRADEPEKIFYILVFYI